jgi:YegS/Rv2252/BmrU family lipid kinase
MAGASDWFVVVNPASGNGRAGRRWPALGRALSAAGVGFEAVLTGHPGHATPLVGGALRAGYRRVLAVGGDGVLHEALNGVMTQVQVAPLEVCLGASPLGSGNDWARARGIPADPVAMARCVAAGRTARQDVGRLDFPEAPPGSCSCHFINVAGAGLDAHVLERLPGGVPRRLAYLLGLLRSLASFAPPRFALEADGRRIEARLLLALLALGPYCGGGMRLVPGASANDGWLDLLTVEPLRLPAELMKLSHLFDGRLPGERFAHYTRARTVSIAAEPVAQVQADGQLVGRTPCVATLLPGAITILRGP